MPKTITISNNTLTASISTMGAELISLKKGDTEYMWDANPDVWAGHAPILFPVCGRLKDGKYIYGGKEYFMGAHGFAKNSLFTLESADSTCAVFLLKANEETKKIYPFDFEFRAVFTLCENSLNIEFQVKNTDNKAIYFSVGSHEAYACPEGIEEYSLIFDQTENLENSLLDGPLLNHKTDKSFGDAAELPLKYSYFDVDTLIFNKLKSRAVTLKNRRTERQVRVTFEGIDHLMIWTKQGANYLCIEPWCGLPDYVDSDYDFVKKPGIISLDIGQEFKKAHSVIL